MLIDLEIETPTLGARGLGRHQGKAVFVPLTAPGDLVRCRIVRSRPQFDEAETVELLSPSALRRIPPCPVFGECGGCQWQHLPYEEQTRWKEKLFHDQLLRLGIASSDELMPIIPAPAEWAYRNRVQFKCRQTQQGPVAGFYRHASHFVTDAPHCLLVKPVIQRTYDFLRKMLPESPQPESLPQFDISCGGDQQVTVLFHLLTSAEAAMCDWLKAVAENGGFAAAVQVGRKETIRILVGSPGMSISVDTPPVFIQVSVGGFAQINADQNRGLVDAVVTAACLTGKERVLDLYCGAGNFTLPVARRAAAVVGIEDYAPAIDDARNNAARNAVANAVFLAESADGAALRHGTFELVLLDPPRTGAYPVMRDLLVLRPQRILYVSCDPATLARDLKPLVHNGYAVVSSQPFDLFPQTWHIESLTVLERVR